MRTLFKPLLTALLVFCSIIIFAQDKSNSLFNEGVALQKEGKHAEATSKFKEALQAEPDNPAANYQLAFSLVAAKKRRRSNTLCRKGEQNVVCVYSCRLQFIGWRL
jgi:Tfp pilus assembly protein PilF